MRTSRPHVLGPIQSNQCFLYLPMLQRSIRGRSALWSIHGRPDLLLFPLITFIRKPANNQMSSKTGRRPKACTKLVPIDSCPNFVRVRFWLRRDRMKRSRSRTGGSHRIQRTRGAALKDLRPSLIKSKAGLFVAHKIPIQRNERPHRVPVPAGSGRPNGP
jgi:hypothetical protein